MHQTSASKNTHRLISTLVIGILVLGGILLTRIQGYLLFHGVAEVFIIVIACAVFIYAWNSSNLVQNSYLMVIGVSFLCYSVIATVHTLAFKGMGVFPANSANLPTQLWIGGRYLLAVSFLAAPFVVGKSVKPWVIFYLFFIVTSLLFLSIFYWHVFPACYIDGKGLTQFKINSEYVISAIFLFSIMVFFRKRSAFEAGIFWLIVAAIFVTISSEIAFTRYIGVYSSANLVGHLLNIVAFYLFYEAILVTEFQAPVDALFKDKNQAIEKLNANNDGLRESNAKLDFALQSARMGVWQWDIVADNSTFDDQTCSILGLDPAVFSGGAAEFYAVVHPDDRENIKGALRRVVKDDTPYDTDYRVVWPDGSIHCISSRGRIVLDSAGVPRKISGVLWDITERKQVEDQIKASLAEKEVLLKEIHHRVKNNMQVISSLLRMQSGFLKDEDDKRMFQESQLRIQSMSLVYNKLYQSENMASISLHGYAKDLVGGLIKSNSFSANTPKMLIEIDDIELSLDFAIPCGLIINEVVTNSLKYAFPQGREGQIHVIIHQKNGCIQMSLGDDGVGLPEGFTIGSTKSLGMVLIQTLVVHQLGGTLELNRKNGTEYLISFPLVFEG